VESPQFEPEDSRMLSGRVRLVFVCRFQQRRRDEVAPATRQFRERALEPLVGSGQFDFILMIQLLNAEVEEPDVAGANAAPMRSYGVGPFKREVRETYARCSITVELANGKTAALSNAENYATDGNALRELIRFYWQHPEHRVELSDGRAQERLSTRGSIPG
jgi:hypothetical protein